MKPPRALLLYQAENTADLLRSVVLNEGGELEAAPFHTPAAAAPIASYRIVLFDIGRPTQRLLESLRAWRDQAPGATVVVIGNRTAQENRFAVLENGATAYLTKPLVVPELAARVRAAFRRTRPPVVRSRQVVFGAGIIDLETRTIRVADGQVRLTPTECGILEQLALRMNHTVPRGELVKTLWGTDPQKGVHSLRLFIRKLRQKIEPDPTHPIYLVTDPLVGYRLQAPPGIVTDSVECD
jgi:two-component system, OmpR family, KDP operon response regulator KdpE